MKNSKFFLGLLLILSAAFLLNAGPANPVPGDNWDNWDNWDDHHYSDRSSSSAPVTALALQNTLLGAASRAEASVWEHLDARALGRDGGFGAWLAPHYEHSKTDDLGVDGLTQRRNSGGSGFGLDFDFENGLLVGGAIDMGYSKVTSKFNNITISKQESEFYSVMGYADWQLDAWRFYGGLGLGYGYTELKLDQGVKSHRDIDSVSLSSAAFAEYTFKLGVDVSPYAGVRYFFQDTEDYRLSGITYRTKEQHIVRFPVGVKVTKEFNAGGFFVRPGINCYVEPVCGDIDAEATMRSRRLGINQTDEARMTDRFHWHATAGVSAGFEAFIFTLSYGYHGTGHEQRHGVSLSYTMLF